MPWLAMPFKDSRLKSLASTFKVRSMPRLIVFKNDGTLLSDDAVESIIEEGPVLIGDWLEA